MTNKQSNLVNGLLLLLVIALAAYILYKPDNNQIIYQLIPSKITAEQAKVMTISIANKSYELTKSHKQWRYTKPLSVNALNNRVEKILQILSYGYSQSYPANSINLRDVGLQPPQAKLSINNQLFAFGNVEQVSKLRYVLYNNNVYLTNDLIYPLLNSRTQGLADMQLLQQEVVATGIKTPYLNYFKKENDWFDSAGKDVNQRAYPLINNWQEIVAIGVEASTAKESLGLVEITTANKIIQYEIIQLEPYFILKPKNKDHQFILSAEDAVKLLNASFKSIEEDLF